MIRHSFTRFLPFSLVLAFCLPGPVLATDSKAHDQYLQAAKLFEQEKYEYSFVVRNRGTAELLIEDVKPG